MSPCHTHTIIISPGAKQKKKEKEKIIFFDKKNLFFSSFFPKGRFFFSLFLVPTQEKKTLEREPLSLPTSPPTVWVLHLPQTFFSFSSSSCVCGSEKVRKREGGVGFFSFSKKVQSSSSNGRHSEELHKNPRVVR